VLKVELHSHTADDPLDRIPHSTVQLINRAAALDYAALAVTLHDKQLDLSNVRDYAADRGIVLIPGIERTIQGKHVLLLNFQSGAEEVHSFRDLAALKRSQPGGLVVAPHPYFPAPSCLWGLLEDHVDLFDAAEVNGMFTESVDFNAPTRRWARANGKPLVGNGDVHRLTQLGTTYSLVDAPADADADAICAAIAAGRVEVVARPHSWRTVGRLLSDIIFTNMLPWDWAVRTPSTDPV
jgi:predicted metal-dependent phosphoesterase TrpH